MKNSVRVTTALNIEIGGLDIGFDFIENGKPFKFRFACNMTNIPESLMVVPYKSYLIDMDNIKYLHEFLDQIIALDGKKIEETK